MPSIRLETARIESFEYQVGKKKRTLAIFSILLLTACGMSTTPTTKSISPVNQGYETNVIEKRMD